MFVTVDVPLESGMKWMKLQAYQNRDCFSLRDRLYLTMRSEDE